MRIKWWIKLLLNACVSAGFAFFSALAGLEIGGIGFNWKVALYAAFIMAGLSFFATCKHYFDEEDKDPKSSRITKASPEQPKLEVQSTPKTKTARSSPCFLCFV